MGFKIKKLNAPTQQFAVRQNDFTKDELEKICFLGGSREFSQAEVGENEVADKGMRDSTVSWLTLEQDTHWLFDKIGQIVSQVNYDHFMLNIDGIESFQFTRYGLNQHYDWHWDVSLHYAEFERKISVVMMLDDPEDYEGGEFELCTNGNLNNVMVVKPKKGEMIFFNSWMPHRCLPVTKGVRRTLVTWIMGKRDMG